MKKQITAVTFLMLLFAGITVNSNAQSFPESGTIGLTASLQANQVDIQAPLWLSEDIVVAPVVGIQSREDDFTTLRFGAKPKFYQSLDNNVAPYLAVQAIFEYTSPAVGDNETALQLGVGGGGDYFLNQHFSIGVEAQLNTRVADQNALSTGAVVNASYYFD